MVTNNMIFQLIYKLISYNGGWPKHVTWKVAAISEI